MINFESMAEAVAELVYKTSDFIRTEASHFTFDKVEKKGKNDLVSYVDKESERKLVKILLELIPESGFITEEGTIQKSGDCYTWIIDPLDGTTNFIHGIPTFSVSIALMEYEEIVFGLVYEINRNEMFYSWKGGGVFLNRKEILVSKNSQFSNSLLATGFPYTQFEEVDKYLALLKVLMKESQGIRRIGSAAVDLAYVACGRFEGYFEFNINSWDIAAGMFLVRMAGGIVTDFSGQAEVFKTRQMVATNGLIHFKLLESINEHFIN